MANRPLFSFFPQKIATTRPVATKITIKQFFLPGGSSTQVKGVASDIVLPSVNEFLRIGESDLDHALAWDQIPATQLGSTWNNKINDLTNSELFDSLKHASTARQTELEEFNFLVRQINWRQERYEEKAISLHLQKRIDKKILEQKYVEALDEEYKTFNEINYETVEFVTKISAEQEALSLKNQVTSDTTEKTNPSLETATLEDKDTEDNDDTPPFDIPLRESARIMADWITLTSK